MRTPRPGPRRLASLATVVAVVAIVVFGGVTFASAGGTTAMQPPDGGDTWPMEGYDPGQTAFNPNAVGPNGDVGPDWISVTGYGPGVTVADDRVFVAGGERHGEVAAYDPGDGTREWRTRLGDAASSKPIVDGDTVYVHVRERRSRDVEFARHEVVALDAETGEVEWRFEADDDRYEFTTFSWKTLTVADGALYVAGEHYDDEGIWDEAGFVLSIDEGGEERWRTDVASHELSQPAVADGTVVVSDSGLGGAELLALAAADGAERWRTGSPGDRDLSQPAIDDGSVYVNARTPLEIDLSDGTIVAEFDVDGSPSRPMAVTNDRLFVPGAPAGEWAPTRLYGVERATGEVEWSYGSRREFSSRPVVGEGTVYVGGGDGLMYALDRDDGEERWTYEVNRNYMVNNEPVVVGETLYVGPVDNRVYALVEGGDAREPAVIGFISRLLPALGDFAGFLATAVLVHLGVGTLFGLATGIALYGLVAGLRLSRAPLRLLAARVFRIPVREVTRRAEFGGLLSASVLGTLVVGLVSALTFGTFPLNGLLTALVVFGGAWAVLAYRWLPTHADDLDRDAGSIRRQWGVLLAVHGLIAGLLYPLVVFVILLGMYFT